MKLFCGILLFIGVFALNNATSPTALKRISTDQLLMQHLIRANENNPSYAAPCFNLYLPIFSAILEEYSASYQKCFVTADAENSVLDKEATGNQTLVSSIGQNVCNNMISCASLESVEFFDCYSQQGDGNVKSLYNLTNIAIDVAAYLRQQYEVVEFNLVKCQNASDRAYVEETTTANEALTYCLANGPPAVVTTTAPTTTEITESTVIDITSTSTTTDATTTTDVSTTDTTRVPDGNGFEEEDLGRSAVLPLNKYNRLR